MRKSALAALLVTASCGFPSVWIEAEEHFTVPATGVSAIDCTTHNGNVSIASPGGSEIAITARKRAGGADEADAGAAMQSLRIVHEVRDATLHLGWEWTTKPASTWGAAVGFDVRCPPGLAARAETHNGNVDVTGPSGPCRIRTHNGNVTLRGSTGVVEIDTRNGNVTAAVSGVERVDGFVTTHNGSIEVALPAEASLQIDASTYNGGISTDLPFRESRADDDRLTGVLGAGDGRLRVETHNGSIRLTGKRG